MELKHQNELSRVNAQMMEKDHMITSLKGQIEHVTGDLDNKLHTYQ